MSLIDRFDDLRAKGVNTNDADATVTDILQGKTAYVKGNKITGTLIPSEGGDFSTIGTTVTVKAQTSILKGSRWEGVLNTEYNRTLTQEELSLETSKFAFSSDLKVALAVGATSTRTSFPSTWDIYIYNEEELTYEKIPVTMPNEAIGRAFENSVYMYARLNEEGTLGFLQTVGATSTGVYERIFFEIDKDNKTVMTYYETDSKQGSTALVINKNIVCIGKNVYEYDRDTHKSNYITSLPYQISEGVNGSLLISNRFVTRMASNYRYAIVDITSGTQTITTDGSLTSSINSSGEIICKAVNSSSQKGTLTFWDFNIASGTLSQITSYDMTFSESNSENTTPIFISDTLLLWHNNIYDVSNIANEAPILLASGARAKIEYMTRADDNKWVANNQKFYFTANDNEAEYLINQKSGMATVSNKYYGIASSNISLGNVGKAQLLFNTNGGASNG